ncbi:MAG: hypothetical protein IPJ65_36170 [Archangiaceae bacterium]|nr:hypothetical protein [Archangiaceae bacterium]
MRVSTHPSPFALEQLHAGDLPTEQRAAAQAHIADCARCLQTLSALEGAQARFLTEQPATLGLARALAQPPRRAAPPRRLVFAGFGALAALAATLALVTLLPSAPVEAVRLKGAAVTVQRERAGAVWPLGPADRIAAGDRLRVVLTVSRPARYMAWLVDAGGTLDRVIDAPLQLEPGVHPLPGSMQVDAPCSELTLVVEAVDGSLEDAEAKLRQATALKGQRLSCE